MALEQPRQSYTPRARVRLAIRFDEFSRTASAPQPPKKPPHLRAGKGVDNKGNLSVVRDGAAYVLRAPDEQTQHGGSPQAQTSSKDDRTVLIEGIIPLRMSINRNGIRTADTCTIELAFLDAPFFPPVIRSCAVQCFLGCLNEADYAREVQGKAPGQTQGALPLSTIPDTYLDAYGRKRTNLRFDGYADEWFVEHSPDQPSIVRLECTDNTRLLIDQDAPPKLVVAADMPLDKAIATYLANFPQFRGLRVEYRPAGATVPSLSVALAKSSYKPKLGPAPTGGAGAGGGGAAKLSVWDYLTDLATSLGLLVRLEGQTIILQRPRTLYASKFSGRPDDPFTGRILPSGRQILNRLFVHGSNIEALSFSRKFTRFQSFNVEVRCFSMRLGQTLVARFPEKKDRQALLVPGDAADEKWQVHTVHGIDDLPTLRVIAQGIYESVGRNEFTSKFSTKNLASFGGGNLDPDALDVQAGDTVEIEVRREIAGGFSVGETSNAIADGAQSYLKSLGYDDDTAAAYGRAMGQVGFPNAFRMRGVSMNWDREQGVSFDFEGINFLEVRRGKSLPAGEEIEPDTTNAKPVKVEVDDPSPGQEAPPGGFTI